jgi:hypothetical protein
VSALKFTSYSEAQVEQLNHVESAEEKRYTMVAKKLLGPGKYVLQPLCFFNPVNWESKCAPLKHILDHIETKEKRQAEENGIKKNDLDTLFAQFAKDILPLIHDGDDITPELTTLRDFLKNNWNLEKLDIPNLSDPHLSAIGNTLFDIAADDANATLTESGATEKIGEALNKVLTAERKQEEMGKQSKIDSKVVDELKATKTHPLFKAGAEVIDDGIWMPHAVCFLVLKTMEEVCIPFNDIAMMMRNEKDFETSSGPMMPGNDTESNMSMGAREGEMLPPNYVNLNEYRRARNGKRIVPKWKHEIDDLEISNYDKLLYHAQFKKKYMNHVGVTGAGLSNNRLYHLLHGPNHKNDGRPHGHQHNYNMSHNKLYQLLHFDQHNDIPDRSRKQRHDDFDDHYMPTPCSLNRNR